jgi:hypothetical protein
MAIFFGNYNKEYKYVDYSLPTIKMLKGAAYRYQLLQLKTLWILGAVILMDVSMTLSPNKMSFVEVQISFLAIVAVSFIIGTVIWYFKYKPLRDKVLVLLADLES